MSCVADIDLSATTPEEEDKWKKCRWVWCNDCGGGSINKIGWGHKKKSGHDVVSLKAAGKLDEAKREFLFLARGGVPAQEAIAREKRVVEAGKTRAGDTAQEDAVYQLELASGKATPSPRC